MTLKNRIKKLEISGVIYSDIPEIILTYNSEYTEQQQAIIDKCLAAKIPYLVININSIEAVCKI